MKIIKENANLDALLLLLLILIPFDYIFFGAFINEKIEVPYSFIFIVVIIIVEMIFLISFSIRNIYRIEINENGIEITYKLKKENKRYEITNIKRIVISNSQRNAMHNINFYFDDNSKFSLPTSEKENLRKVYRFFKDKDIECKVVGLPSGRTPEDYNW
jgi:hypothetical protein